MSWDQNIAQQRVEINQLEVQLRTLTKQKSDAEALLRQRAEHAQRLSFLEAAAAATAP